MLAAPDLDKKMRMEVDTLDYVMGYYRWSVKMDYGDQWHSYPNY